jgi:hypothetical protein
VRRHGLANRFPFRRRPLANTYSNPAPSGGLRFRALTITK